MCPFTLNLVMSVAYFRLGTGVQKSRCRTLGMCISLTLGNPRERFLALINARSPIFCISRFTHLCLTGSAIELLSVS
jgi:hypothetical protein